MLINKVEVSRTITFRQQVNTATNSSFTIPIHIEFIPDEIVCKYTSCVSQIGGNPFTLDSTICKDFSIPMNDTIILDPVITYTNLNLHYMTSQPINGQYTFNMILSNNDFIGNRGVAIVFFILEFVKYKEVPLSKIF